MSRARSVWDYSGIVAECFDLWFGAEPFADQDFYARRIAEGRGPALEIGSGTGRLLLPYLRDGLPVEGLDASPDMLAHCRSKARALGLEPTLHQGLMQDFELPARYATIYVPQCSLHILTEDGEGLEALRTFRRHLLPGGRLFVSLAKPIISPGGRPEWTRRRHGELPGDGGSVSIFTLSHFDGESGILRTQMRYELERDGTSEVVLEKVLRERYWSPPAFVLALEQAGFEEIEVYGDHREEPACEQHTIFVYAAAKA